MAAVLEGAAPAENSKGHGHGKAYELHVKRGEPSLVAPAAETERGSLYFLSNLDQHMPHDNVLKNMVVIVKTIYCFRAVKGRGTEGVAAVMKEALAKVLVHYHPLAGRLALTPDQRKLVVSCTGEGAVFVEADTDCDLEEIGDISIPDESTLEKLVYIPSVDNILDTPLVIAQVTRFRCGGFVLGFAINHSLVDGVTAIEFINSWGETARGLPLSVPPFLDRTHLKARNPPRIEFPHEEFAVLEDLSHTATLFQEQTVYKSFSFDQGKLRQLKMKVVEGGTLDGCSSFEALSALIWKSRVQALRQQPHQQTKLLFPINVRAILRPPLPKGYFGNAIIWAYSLCTVGELLENPLSFAVGLVQKAIKMVTDDYVRSAIDHMEVATLRRTIVATLLVTNWAKLPFRTVDFGWGEPQQFGSTDLPGKDAVSLLQHGNERNGVDVLLGLPTSAMMTFEQLMEI